VQYIITVAASQMVTLSVTAFDAREAREKRRWRARGGVDIYIYSCAVAICSSALSAGRAAVCWKRSLWEGRRTIRDST